MIGRNTKMVRLGTTRVRNSAFLECFVAQNLSQRSSLFILMVGGRCNNLSNLGYIRGRVNHKLNLKTTKIETSIRII